MGIDSQTLQTLDVPEEKVCTPIDEEPVIYIDKNDEDAGRPVQETLKNPLVFGWKKRVPVTKDKDGYDIGASCSNQRNNNNKGPEGRGQNVNNNNTPITINS